MERKQTFPGEFLAWLFIFVLALVAFSGCLTNSGPPATEMLAAQAPTTLEVILSVLR